MLFWITQQITVSLILIALVHSIYVFLQNNLTTPKIRDLVKRPLKDYNEIYETIKTLPQKSEDSPDMKNELQNYLKELSSSIKTPAPIAPMGHNSVSNKFTDNFQSL